MRAMFTRLRTFTEGRGLEEKDELWMLEEEWGHCCLKQQSTQSRNNGEFFYNEGKMYTP
jgi:hypothetical protein